MDDLLFFFFFFGFLCRLIGFVYVSDFVVVFYFIFFFFLFFFFFFFYFFFFFFFFWLIDDTNRFLEFNRISTSLDNLGVRGCGEIVRHSVDFVEEEIEALLDD